MILEFIWVSFFCVSEYLYKHLISFKSIMQSSFRNQFWQCHTSITHTYINAYKHKNRQRPHSSHFKISAWFRYDNTKSRCYKRDAIQTGFLPDGTNQGHLFQWLIPFYLYLWRRHFRFVLALDKSSSKLPIPFLFFLSINYSSETCILKKMA